MKLKTNFSMIQSRWATYAVLGAAAFGSFPAAPAHAASLLLAPTRLLFEGGARAQELTIMNQSDTVQTYRLRLEDRDVKADGEYVVIADPTSPLAASSMLRLSVRQVTIPPRESVTVRVLLRKPAGLASGEVRSHLIVSELPAVSPPIASSTVGEGLSVTITTIFGISIPVMVRNGETSARLAVPTLRRVSVPDQPTLENLQVRLETTGNRSMFVDLKVFPARQRRGPTIVEARGVSIYNPANARDLTITLNPEQAARLRNGSNVMTYQEVSKDGSAIGPISEVAF